MTPPRWLLRALAALGALTLLALTAAAFLAYLRPEAVMDFANRFYLCY
jgi:hypothetical protein